LHYKIIDIGSALATIGVVAEPEVAFSSDLVGIGLDAAAKNKRTSSEQINVKEKRKKYD